MIPGFEFARIPGIHFGPGTFSRLADVVSRIGDRVLVVTGERSLEASGRWIQLSESLDRRSVTLFHVRTGREPSPDDVDRAVSEFRSEDIRVVLAVGGGSVLDLGKAISAMLPHEKSVTDFLEGIGTEEHSGEKVPFVAVPTTSGTGSEATKNAVLSKIGPDGYKKSLRHDNFVPDAAVVDPELILSCPPDVTASTGMDACTQLLEALVSPAATPLTDLLALEGLKSIKDNLVAACTDGAGNVEVRGAMAYAALLSGICLANAGLGIVHGLASPIGGYFPVPHGVVCGTLLASATWVNIEALRREETGDEALRKYARVGWLFSGRDGTDVTEGCDRLVEVLDEWTEQLDIPKLGAYGVAESDVSKILDHTGLKNNPVQLDRGDIQRILEDRI